MLVEKGGLIIKLVDNTSIYRILEESASHSKDDVKLTNIELNVLNLRKNFFLRKFRSIKNNKKLYSFILNSSFKVLLHYKNKISTNERDKILIDLKENGLRLSLDNWLKKNILN